MHGEGPATRRWWHWMWSPAMGVVGTLASIIGLPMSVWLYVRSVPSRELAVVEPSVRAVLVGADAPAVLDVRINGEPVKGADVFAVQLAVWNRGNQPIRPENVLEAVSFLPEGPTRVGDCSVLRASRSLCGFRADRRPDGKAAELKWTILEPGDGALIQLVLVGDRACRIGITGALEGSGRPTYLRIHRTDTPPPAKPAWTVFGDVPLSGGTVVFGLICSLLFVGAWRQFLLDRKRLWQERRRVEIGVRVLIAGLGLLFGLLTFAAIAWELATSYRVPDGLLGLR